MKGRQENSPVYSFTIKAEKGRGSMKGRQENSPMASELDKLKGIVEKNPFAAYIGMELLEAADGQARARIQLRPQLENIYGGMHGGCMFSLADTLAGIAAASYGSMVTTLDASMNYMRPVAGTEYLYCEARVLRNGAAVSVVHTELMDDRGRLLADGSFTYYHLQTSAGKNR